MTVKFWQVLLLRKRIYKSTWFLTSFMSRRESCFSDASSWSVTRSTDTLALANCCMVVVSAVDIEDIPAKSNAALHKFKQPWYSKDITCLIFWIWQTYIVIRYFIGYIHKGKRELITSKKNYRHPYEYHLCKTF